MRLTKFRKILGVATALIFCVAVAPADAQAHAKLTLSVPAADAVVTEPPKELRLVFNEGLIAKFSRVELKNGKGEKVETGPAGADPADAKQLILPLTTALPDGLYSVTWHAVSEDTHKLDGAYAFSVKR